MRPGVYGFFEACRRVAYEARRRRDAPWLKICASRVSGVSGAMSLPRLSSRRRRCAIEVSQRDDAACCARRSREYANRYAAYDARRARLLRCHADGARVD